MTRSSSSSSLASAAADPDKSSAPSPPSLKRPTAKDARYVAFALTHVEYEHGDAMGLVLALVCLTPFATLVGLATLLLFRRELHTATIALGIVLNEVLSWGLKRLIAQPRPTREQHHHHQEASALGKRAGGALLGTLQEMITADSEDARTAEAVAEAQVLSSTPQISTQFTEFGMPSSHAQFAFFVAVYLILFMYASRRHQAASFANPHWRHLISVLLLAGAALIAFARVYLWYHTSLQVVVGAFVGAAAAAAWHHITNRWLRPCFPHIQRWRIARYFYIRDSSHIPNILRFEYDAAVQESERRAREAASKGQ